MGMLENGKWIDKWYDTDKHDGEFKRENASIRDWVKPSSDTNARFKVESNRYHIYISHACPWSNRVSLYRLLKKLDKHISMSVVATDMLENGWTFDKKHGSTGDDLFHANYMYEIYTRHHSNYTGRVTVPVLWDKKHNQIVNNESSDIMQMLDNEFSELTDVTQSFRPESLLSEIKSLNDDIYHHVNNGVYKCGFATSQAAYEKAYLKLFDTLDRLEAQLAHTNAFLLADKPVETDWRLFVTLIRFDMVYYTHFKCNHKRISDYPNLWKYLKALYHYPNVRDTIHFDHIKRHYFYSHKMINPTQIVPIGPEISF